MNLQIKALLLLSFLWRCIISVQAQTVLQQENNLFRDGDAVLKQELHYKHPGRSGKNVIWDFSELALLNRGYQEQYIGSIDTTSENVLSRQIHIIASAIQILKPHPITIF